MVSHHLDGLRLPALRGLVASRYRPWGSPDSPFRRGHCRDRSERASRCPPYRAFPTRVAAQPSPSAVASSPFTDVRHRLDLEAFLHASIRCSHTPLPARPARCSPGLSLLKPHHLSPPRAEAPSGPAQHPPACPRACHLLQGDVSSSPSRSLVTDRALARPLTSRRLAAPLRTARTRASPSRLFRGPGVCSARLEPLPFQWKSRVAPR